MYIVTYRIQNIQICHHFNFYHCSCLGSGLTEGLKRVFSFKVFIKMGDTEPIYD